MQKREALIRQRWEENNIFQRSIENRDGAESFVFYEGPPTANGLPHAGHALGRTIKDFVARYKTMSGFQVLRKAGWDTHGLPVELEVEKQLDIRGKDEIEAYGVEQFIEKCKESVFKYEGEWRRFTEKLGYWVDMESPYVTLDNTYIESVWNILSTIHAKQLLYKGHRVVPYCPHCETSLSSHEVAQGYKDVTDLSVTAKFRIEGEEDVFLLGWTTTPWTLPGNVALAVNPDMNYVKVKQGNENYIVAEALLSSVMKNAYQVLESFKGSELVGYAYQPPFSFVQLQKGHKVLAADFVTDLSGTGIVHIAPAHGEDDYELIKQAQFDYINVVDTKGRYQDIITPLAGKLVKDSDVEIIKMLSENQLLYDKEKYQHSYPHCWRCDSPLIYYAMAGWFIKTTAIKEQIQANNQEVEWFPSHIKNGRFGNFLANMVDWNIGRNRYWGTPLNVWVCQKCGQEKSPDSIQALREYAVKPLPDDIELHKPYVDKIHLVCDCGEEMVRTNEVIDVWFDSGSMPFAQYHVPFENEALFKKQFPADVVIEGIDQTRGWFYSLLAVSTLLTSNKPYKRVLSLGHILDEHGQKMSKSKGNALNPVDLIDKFGADALRWALLSDSSPWQNKRFSEKTVSQAKTKIIDTLTNVHSFYQTYAKIDQFNPESDKGGEYSQLDRWILSRLNTLVETVSGNLDGYDLTKAAKQIAHFVDQLSNWYIRRSRQRFWDNGMNKDKRAAFSTLFDVLTTLAQLMAPFTPFVTDEIFTDLTGESVHLADFPISKRALIDQTLEEDMELVLVVIERARSARNLANIPTKQPLAQLIVVPKINENLTQLNQYATIIKEEINVKEVEVSPNHQGNWQLNVKLNFSVAGPKFGSKVGLIKQYVNQLTSQEKTELATNQSLTIIHDEEQSFVLNAEDVLIEKVGKDGFVLSEDDRFIILLDTKLTNTLKQEGQVRTFIREVQDYRKALDLPVERYIDLHVHTDEQFEKVLHRFKDMLNQHLLVNKIQFEEKIQEKAFKIADYEVSITI